MRHWLTLLTTVTLVSAVCAPVRAETILTERLVGSWAGQGQVRERPEAAMERGACRMTASSSDAGRSVVVQGRCAGAAKSVPITIRFQHAGDKLSADFASSATEPRNVALVGRTTADGIYLSTRAPLSLDGRRYAAKIALSFSGDSRFRMVEELTDLSSRKSTVIFNMTFTRR